MSTDIAEQFPGRTDRPGVAETTVDRLWDRSGSFFDTRPQRRAERRRAERELERRRRQDADPGDSRAELSQLSRNIEAAGRDYMARLRADGDILAITDDEEEALDQGLRRVNRAHDDYARMITMVALRPLRAGVSASSVVQVMGTLVGLYLLSPEYREVVSFHRPAVANALEAREERRTARAMARGAHEATRRWRKGHQDQDGSGRDLVSSRWARRYDLQTSRGKGQRQPWDPVSVGLTEVALGEQAFWAVREDRAHADDIMKRHDRLVDRLYEQGENDGLDRREMAEASRRVLSWRMKEQPSVAVMVPGLAHGEILPGPGGALFGPDGFERDISVLDEDTGHVTAGFQVRGTQSVEAHRSLMADLVSDQLLEAAESGDERAFTDALVGTVSGYIARARDLDEEDAPPEVGVSMRRARTAMASMADDGLDVPDQREAAAGALSDALNRVMDRYPEFQRSWQRDEGSTWDRFLRRAADDPAAAVRGQEPVHPAEADETPTLVLPAVAAPVVDDGRGRLVHNAGPSSPATPVDPGPDVADDQDRAPAPVPSDARVVNRLRTDLDEDGRQADEADEADDVDMLMSVLGYASGEIHGVRERFAAEYGQARAEAAERDRDVETPGPVRDDEDETTVEMGS